MILPLPALLLALTISLASARPPNVVIFLSDDQGWGDLGIHGNPDLATPHIDSLAREGARFEHFYVSPVCSPTRAEFLTGRFHQRGGVYSTSSGGERLDLDETTLADVFRAAGYATGAFGKWHNGNQFPYHPNGRGFDEFYGFCSGHWGRYFNPMLDHNGEIVSGSGFATDDFTSRAITFIQRNRERPFLCYLPFNTPHSPMQVPDPWWNRFRDKTLTRHARDPEKEDDLHLRCALAMCENIDANVGRVLSTLEALDLSDETIVLYFSDNGPNGWRWNGGMKGIKGSTDEGGVRSPLLVRWPGHIPAGTTVTTLGAAIDLLPTLAELAGVPLSPSKPLDGVSLKTSLQTGTDPALAGRRIFSTWAEKASVRTPRFRLDHQGRLFDMTADPGQDRDVSADHPDVTADLALALKNHVAQMTAELGTDTRPFLIAHPGDPRTQIPARDGTPHGGIERSSRHPNDSFFTRWTQPADSISWPAEVGATGDYQVEILYTCPPEDIGSTIELSFGDDRLTALLTEARASPLLGAAEDRSPRQESYVQDWRRAKLGNIHLKQGPGTLRLRALVIPGKQVMDFRMLLLTRL